MEKPISKSRLYITAHGIYEAEINGNRIGDHVLAPGWTPYNHELSYQTFDITNILKEGNNAICVHAAEGWFLGRLGFHGGRTNIWGDKLGVIAQLSMTYEDGTAEVLGSDSTWKASKDASPIISASIYDGETYNLSKKQQDWSSPGFDDKDWDKVTASQHNTKLLRAPDGPPIRRIQEMPVVKIQTNPTGKTILDFGQNLVGRVRFKVPNPTAVWSIVY
jgi:alpha-L-rhamnosidase